MSQKKRLGLSDAYAVETPEDSLRVYREWAETYDSEFASTRGYSYPRALAELFAGEANLDDSPVLDVGAGTGLVAQALVELYAGPVDAIDISTEMLEVSRGKGVYRELIEADLTAELPLEDARYGGIVSAGTFTHGHVGPAALLEILRVSRTGALFCLGINATAFDKYGFGSAFAALQARGAISPLEFVETKYYDCADDEHADDSAYTAVFRKR
ncbi:MAG: ubiquinone/menaquinone biosynthesis C-methylase UbiE [Halioglobus sp.]|jgi:ubiquinone/menaquinone biosynthesis C-methylase UbiE